MMALQTIRLKSFNLNDSSQFEIYSKSDEPSLPKSIHQGILSSEYEYVLWLDADGSMSAKDSARFIKNKLISKLCNYRVEICKRRWLQRFDLKR